MLALAESERNVELPCGILPDIYTVLKAVCVCRTRVSRLLSCRENMMSERLNYVQLLFMRRRRRRKKHEVIHDRVNFDLTAKT